MTPEPVSAAPAPTAVVSRPPTVVVHAAATATPPPATTKPKRVAPQHPTTLRLALNPAQREQFAPPTRPTPLRPADDFVPASGVQLVPPSEVPVSGANVAPAKSVAPPKAPTLPSAPSAPGNDSPTSFGGALSGPAGGVVLLFAALAAVLMIIPPWLTSRVAMSVAAPVEWRRRLSLERPG
ncbi:MAG TPA: hypothetical protein VF094_04505 [Gaiellaceae bacterium]